MTTELSFTAEMPSGEDCSGWKGALSATLRQKDFLEPTERIYHDWAARFVCYVAPRPVDQANASDVGNFLTDLAVRDRCSRSVQKQALNAIGFFLREALHLPLQDVVFQRAAAARSLPALLTEAEAERLRRQLDGTMRLIADLAYGLGLNLADLLRRRVHHADPRRGRLVMGNDKGADFRACVLPSKLAALLAAHIERLHRLHSLDRAAGLPGVRVPKGLAATGGPLGESYGWQWLFPARALVFDPHTGLQWRHHLTDGDIERAVREAAARARIGKRVTLLTLERSYDASRNETSARILPFEPPFTPLDDDPATRTAG